MQNTEIRFDKNMLAYCGLYCEQCSFKTAYEEQNEKHLEQIPYQFTKRSLSDYNCGGCKGYCICGVCEIKPCASAKNIESCAECDSFPCQLIDSFENDGMPHHRSAIENLKDIRKNGLEAWYSSLQSILRCQCGEKQTWYYTCPLHK